MKIKRYFFISILFFLSIKSYGDKLEKGFEKLKIFDYFGAKEYFEKTLDDDKPAAAYGLASIYSTEKNPFYNPDSARKFILISDSTFKLTKDKTKKYYATFGVTQTSISKLSDFICDDAFNKAKKTGTSEGYNHYLKFYSGCSGFTDATSKRNACAFNEAKEKNSSVAYKEFMELYPQANQYDSAKKQYQDRMYDENTSGNTIHEYEEFIKNFPDNPNKPKAEKMIYSLSVPDKTIEQYAAYARKYKGAPYTDEAWRKAYKLSMTDYSKKTFTKFKSDYPDYPFPEEIENDFILQNYVLLPYQEENLWGYINEQGESIIKPAYDDASLFKEGLAAVSSGGKFGYINKAGKKIVDFQFKDAESFHDGCAVVLKDSLYGLIDKEGDFLIQPKYNELSEVSDDIYMAVKNENSGYIHKNGQPLTEFIFDQAFDFKNGFSIVNKDEKFGLLSINGYFTIQPKYSGLVFIGNGLLKALNENDLWGIVNVNGDTILPFTYDAIGEFSEHLALAAIKDKCGYVNEKGKVVIPLTFKYSSIMLTTGQFQNGYALLNQKIKSVIIDTTGKALTFSGCQDYGHPSQGFVPVKKTGKWGFTNMSGKIKIPCMFEAVEPFNDYYALIKLKKLTGLIDTAGNVFIMPLYQDIVVSEKAIVVRSNGKFGLLTRAGILLFPCQYDKIEFITPLIARATDAKGITYVNLENGKVIYKSEDK